AQGLAQQQAQQQLAAIAPTPRPAPPPPRYAPIDPDEAPGVMSHPGGKPPSVTLDAAEIAFTAGGKSLSAEDNRRLAEAATMQKQGGASLRVIGYAARGSGADAAEEELQSFNAALDRANAVAAELARLGVPAARITVQAAPALGGSLPPGQVEVLLEY
ncbi:MAG TPA: OmpA family protein, partial [Stellaceae bacterium]|nr:OmpA family protein [Stellaceae bacterium]